MAASTMTKVLETPGFTRITSLTSTPASPTSRRPGSKVSSQSETGRLLADHLHELGDRGRLLVGVNNPQAAADIEAVDAMAVAAQLLDQAAHLRTTASR